jgi:hypothetical protein
VQRHDTDVTSLVLGLVMVGIAAVWALVQTGVLTPDLLPLAIPVLLITVGAVGVAAAFVRSRPSEPPLSDPTSAPLP